MSRRSLPTPRRPAESGESRGRPYLLWQPDTPPPWPAMVIVHGAGSRKENHGDFARACAAAGWVALAYDQRGHGESAEPMSPEAIADLDAMARLLAAREGVDAGRVCARGSSLGGFVAIHGAAGSEAIAGVIAICPAGEQHLLRGLRHGTLEMRTDEGSRRALELWLSEHDLRTAVTALRGRPLILIHADADEQIPCDWSRLLYEAAGEPSRLIIVPGGHHRSVQHDPELAAVALRWLERALDAGKEG